MNSFIQQMFQINGFKVGLFGDTRKPLPPLFVELRRLMSQMQTSQSPVSLQSFFNTCCVAIRHCTPTGYPASYNQPVSAWTIEQVQSSVRANLKRLKSDQLDVSEFAIRLFTAIDSNWLPQLFISQATNQTTCSVDVTHEHKADEVHWFLGVDLNNHQSLERALSAMVTPEFVTGDNKKLCDECNRSVDFTKQMKLTNCPPNLLFHLKRFDPTTFHKNNEKFHFPRQLNIFECLSEEAKHSFVKSDHHSYELSGVILHSGSHQRGHYVSLVFDRSTTKWMLLNDANVTFIDDSVFVKLCTGGIIARGDIAALNGVLPAGAMQFYQSCSYVEQAAYLVDYFEKNPISAYMLFYERRDVYLQKLNARDQSAQSITRSLTDSFSYQSVRIKPVKSTFLKQPVQMADHISIPSTQPLPNKSQAHENIDQQAIDLTDDQSNDQSISSKDNQSIIAPTEQQSVETCIQADGHSNETYIQVDGHSNNRSDSQPTSQQAPLMFNVSHVANEELITSSTTDQLMLCQFDTDESFTQSTSNQYVTRTDSQRLLIAIDQATNVAVGRQESDTESTESETDEGNCDDSGADPFSDERLAIMVDFDKPFRNLFNDEMSPSEMHLYSSKDAAVLAIRLSNINEHKRAVYEDRCDSGRLVFRCKAAFISYDELQLKLIKRTVNSAAARQMNRLQIDSQILDSQHEKTMSRQKSSSSNQSQPQTPRQCPTSQADSQSNDSSIQKQSTDQVNNDQCSLTTIQSNEEMGNSTINQSNSESVSWRLDSSINQSVISSSDIEIYNRDLIQTKSKSLLKKRGFVASIISNNGFVENIQRIDQSVASHVPNVFISSVTLPRPLEQAQHTDSLLESRTSLQSNSSIATTNNPSSMTQSLPSAKRRSRIKPKCRCLLILCILFDFAIWTRKSESMVTIDHEGISFCSHVR